MKKILLGALLLLSMTIHSQGNSDEDNYLNGNNDNAGGSENSNGNNPNNTPTVPIGSILFITTIAGIFFAYKIVKEKN